MRTAFSIDDIRQTIRILVIDDHPVLRAGLRALLIAEFGAGLQIQEAENSGQALQAVKEACWDLVIMDLNLRAEEGLPVLHEITTMHPALPVLVLSSYDEDAFAVPAIKAGARGFVSKSANHTDLIKALKAVLNGGRYVSERSAQAMVRELFDKKEITPHTVLSTREREVLCLLGSGKTQSEIAVQMGLSIKTVSTFRTRLLSKLDLKTTPQLIRYAIEHQLADLDQLNKQRP